ncbi:glycerate kinase [Oerskovia flava]|uniref:glycerate kinase n=1 Tax=Oerskovia flava TaxID=2986422 RepID=UPI00223EC8BF|nr:glycerate kinase [Oerskovia sp. JB1-3-2]
MRVLVAAAGPLPLLAPGVTAVAATFARWWSAAAPRAQTSSVELAGPGPGFLDALAHAAPDVVGVTVRGADGSPVPVSIRLAGHDGPGGTRTAYLDAGRAVGPAPAGGDRWDASSVGVGELLAAGVRAAGPGGRVVLATGGTGSGSGVHDAGAGLIAGVAAAGVPEGTVGADLGPLTRGARGLADLTAGDLDVLHRARDLVAGVDLVAATDDDLPLLGLHGASAALRGPDVTDAVAQDLERATGHYAHLVARALAAGSRPSLLAEPGGGGPRALERSLTALPGAGSGGGLGFAVAALGGRLLPGLRVVADAVGLAEQVTGADLVVAVVDTLDGHELHGGLVPELSRHAAGVGAPLVVLARQAQAGRREWSAAGASGVYELPGDPTADLAGRVARVARTWTP